MTLHVHSPAPTRKVRMRMDCSCGKNKRHVMHHYEWYGPTLWCECGDSWECDIEGMARSPRPFARGWRKKAQARFEVLWSEAS